MVSFSLLLNLTISLQLLLFLKDILCSVTLTEHQGLTRYFGNLSTVLEIDYFIYHNFLDFFFCTHLIFTSVVVEYITDMLQTIIGYLTFLMAMLFRSYSHANAYLIGHSDFIVD